MDESEFDNFAEEYNQILSSNVRVSGDGPEYFARYKIQALSTLLAEEARNKLYVLDFGAGIGASIPHFRELMPEAELTCLDVSNKSLEIARSTYPGQADFISFDGVTIPFPDNTFDVAFAACVFHHIPAMVHCALLAELIRVLSPYGHCVIFEHNPFHPLTVRAVNTCPFDKNAVLIKASDLSDRFKQAGFRDVSHHYQLFFPVIFKCLRNLERFLTWLPIGAQYFVVGRK